MNVSVNRRKIAPKNSKNGVSDSHLHVRGTILVEMQRKYFHHIRKDCWYQMGFLEFQAPLVQ